MIFDARKDWEVDLPLLKVFKDPDTRIYRMFEVALNVKLLHVDIMLVDETDDEPTTYFKRLILSETDSALSLVAREEVKDHRISLQTPRDVDDIIEGYKIWPIREIYEAEDHFGQRAEIFVGPCNFRYIDSPVAESEDELKYKKRIYFKEDVNS